MLSRVNGGLGESRLTRVSVASLAFDSVSVQGLFSECRIVIGHDTSCDKYCRGLSLKPT